MAKFVFRLSGILNIKEKLEEQEKISYGIARTHLTEEENKLSELYRRRNELLDSKKKLMGGVINARELNLTENAIKSTDLSIDDQVLNVKKAQKALENARIRLEQAMIERKTYEKLKENAYNDYLKELEHSEQLEINELVSYRHGRVGA